MVLVRTDARGRGPPSDRTDEGRGRTARAGGETATHLAGMLGAMKVTFDIADADVYRAIKVEAARSDRSVREIVEEALAEWLERREEAEDREAAAEALAEYARDGGRPADAFFATLAAEVRAEYGPG